MAVTVTSTTIQVKDKASPKEAVPSPEPNLWDKMVSWMNPKDTAPAAAAAPKEEFGLLVKLGITRQPRFDEDAVSSRIYSISSLTPSPTLTLALTLALALALTLTLTQALTLNLRPGRHRRRHRDRGRHRGRLDRGERGGSGRAQGDK